MKKIIVTALFSLLCTSVMATTASAESTQATILSEDSVTIARILLDPQMKSCLNKFHHSKFQFHLQSVSKKVADQTKSIFTFSGIAVQGGDMARGTIDLTVEATVETGIFGQPMTMYSCEMTAVQTH